MKKQTTPMLIVGEDSYELDKYYIEGALAMRAQISWKSNPYKDGSARNFSWSYGHVNESTGEHIREGVDVLMNANAFAVWPEDKNVPRDGSGSVDREWYRRKLDAIRSADNPDKKTDVRTNELLDLEGRLRSVNDPLALIYEWVKTGHMSKTRFKEALDILNNRDCDAGRVLEWMHSEDRKPANTAFTAGPERQAAYWIEIGQDALKPRRSMKP